MPEGTRPPDEPSDPSQTSRPPVTDETDWRARALDAESKLAALQTEATNLRAQLDRAAADLANEKQSRQIDRALSHAGVIDPEVASLLLTNMLASQPPPQTTGDTAATHPDINTLIQTLRAEKPFLFESALPSSPTPSALSPMINTTPAESLADLAAQARASGDRRSLLTYLRARRAV